MSAVSNVTVSLDEAQRMAREAYERGRAEGIAQAKRVAYDMDWEACDAYRRTSGHRD